jgi:hypothetical protein
VLFNHGKGVTYGPLAILSGCRCGGREEVDGRSSADRKRRNRMGNMILCFETLASLVGMRGGEQRQNWGGLGGESCPKN